MTVRSVVAVAALTVLTTGRVAAQAAQPGLGQPGLGQPGQPVDADFFETRIRPVLSANCFGCHSSKLSAPRGELTLDTKAGALKGGRLGPDIVPGKPDESRLLEALRYTNPGLQMPPRGKLPETVLADFERWIAAGAPDPRVDAPVVASANPGKRVVGEAELAKGRQWWAFQPVLELPAPAVSHTTTSQNAARQNAAHRDAAPRTGVPSTGVRSAGVRTKIDNFVLAKLSEKGLAPSPEADARTLVRRAYIDLIGLRPTYDEVETYAADKSPDKYERLVDRLLAMPQYGERWGRHWLDVVRYAEANAGGLTTPPYPHAWRYRDWIIESLNKDLPYDRFVKLQLAADLMPDASPTDLRALGILALAPDQHKEVRLSLDAIGTLQMDDWDERVDTVSRGLLGLSVACARCHDHKFDPIQQKDYYRLASVFASTSRGLRPYFPIDRATATRFMWIYERVYDLNYTANLLERDPGSKPEQAARQVKMFRAEVATLQAELDTMSKAHPEIGAYLKTVPYPGEIPPEDRNPDGTLKKAAEPIPNDAPKAADDAKVAVQQKKRRGSGKAIDPNAPFLNSVYDAGRWFDDSQPDLTMFKMTPGVPHDLALLKGGNVLNPGDPAPRGFPVVLSKGDADFHQGSGRLELGEKVFTDAAPLSARVIVNRVWGWHFDNHLVATPSDFGVQGTPPTHPELLADLAARFIAHGWSLKWLHREIMLSATYRQSSRPRADAMDADPTNALLWRVSPHRMDIESYRDSLLQIAGTLDKTLYGPSADVETGTRRTVYATLTRDQGKSELLKLYDAPAPIAHIPARYLTISPLQDLFVMNSEFVQGLAATLARRVDAKAPPEDTVRKLYRTVFARDATPDEVALGIRYLATAGVLRYAHGLLSTNEVIFCP